MVLLRAAAEGATAPAEVVSANAARAAAASSPQVAYRSSGAFARAFATTASTSAGRPSRSSLGAGGGSIRCAYMTATFESRSKGFLPVKHS